MLMRKKKTFTHDCCKSAFLFASISLDFSEAQEKTCTNLQQYLRKCNAFSASNMPHACEIYKKAFSDGSSFKGHLLIHN
ncbi:UNVERIFIED_CONTAM: hypothetical protein NCL1_49519 [Trichonephila clavipes]